MIETLTLKFGRAPGVPPESIRTTPVTVFVGPNNSGKSKVLAEIYGYCMDGRRDLGNVIVDKISFSTSPSDIAKQRIRRATLPPRPTETLRPGRIIVGKAGHHQQVPEDDLVQSLLDPEHNVERFCEWYLSYNTLILDGRSRIDLVKEQNAGDLQEPPQTSFQTLFRDNVKRAEIRRIIHDAFGTNLVLTRLAWGSSAFAYPRRLPCRRRRNAEFTMTPFGFTMPPFRSSKPVTA